MRRNQTRPVLSGKKSKREPRSRIDGANRWSYHFSFAPVAKGSFKISATSHQPLSKNDSGNSAGSGNVLRSAMKQRDSGGRVLSEVATRLRRLALRQRLQAEATVSSLLVAKSLTYLLLNLPNYGHRIWNNYLRPQQAAPSQEQGQTQNGAGSPNAFNETEFLLQVIVYLIFYTQYALNFVIYSSNAFVRNVCNQRSRPSSLVLK